MSSILKATISGSFYGNLWQNVLHFEDTNTSSEQLLELAFELNAGWVQIVKQGQPREVLYSLIEVRDDQAPNLAPALLPISVVGDNSGSDQWLPELAYVFKWHTALNGPAHRGRAFINGFTTAHVTFGVINPACRAFWQPKFALLLERYSATSSQRFKLVVRHPEGWDRVHNITLSDHVGHLKSRRAGVGACGGCP